MRDAAMEKDTGRIGRAISPAQASSNAPPAGQDRMQVSIGSEPRQ